MGRFSSLVIRGPGLCLLALVHGCTLTPTVDPFGEQVRLVCEETGDTGELALTIDGETRVVEVHKTNDPDQIFEWCGGSGSAAVGCAHDQSIFLPSGPTCNRIAAHELGHVFRMPGTDRPQYASRR